MQKFILFALTLICFSSWVKNKRSFTPPGTVQITETLFADKNEITNFSWLEYTMWTRVKFGNNSKEYLASLPDTTVWNDSRRYSSSLTGIYFRNPAYRDYPVVGISYEQALAFCNWRSEVVKSVQYRSNKKTIDLEYRLPTKKEWELLACNGAEVFNTENYIKCVKKTKDQTVYKIYYEANCLINDSVSLYMYTKPVSLYGKNKFGLYDMIGNVSEMVAETGTSKGGSWINVLEDCRVGKDQLYIKPESWLGFRCVCDVK